MRSWEAVDSDGARAVCGFSGRAPATLLGTNKAASVWGTAMATGNTAARCRSAGRPCCPQLAAGLLGSFVGAWAVTVVSADFLRKLLPLVLLGVLLTPWQKAELGRHHTPGLTAHAETGDRRLPDWRAHRFYDGFFGPVRAASSSCSLRLLWVDFLNASASAKLLNCATNIAAIALFAAKGPCGGTCGDAGRGQCIGAACWARTWRSNMAPALCGGIFIGGGEHADPEDGVRRFPAVGLLFTAGIVCQGGAPNATLHGLPPGAPRSSGLPCMARNVNARPIISHVSV